LSDSRRPEGGVDRIPHVVEAACVLELVRIDVERDARACVAELARCSYRIDPRADQVTRERVPEIVEPDWLRKRSKLAVRHCDLLIDRRLV
jgi:hypothetical protein